MNMTGWRGMYWLFVAVGVVGVILGVMALVRRARSQRYNALGVGAVGLVILGLTGTLVVAIAGPGGFMSNMMGMRGMGMMRDRSDVRPPPPPSPGAPRQFVTGTEFAFSPTEFRVQSGQTVNLEFINAGSVFHTFTIGDLNFELEANGGQRAAGALRADRPGAYEFICSVSGHAQSGMRGRVFVD